MTDKPKSWNGGAGGAPILSQPIADWRRFPFSGGQRITFWQLIRYVIWGRR